MDLVILNKDNSGITYVTGKITEIAVKDIPGQLEQANRKKAELDNRILEASLKSDKEYLEAVDSFDEQADTEEKKIINQFELTVSDLEEAKNFVIKQAEADFITKKEEAQQAMNLQLENLCEKKEAFMAKIKENNQEKASAEHADLEQVEEQIKTLSALEECAKAEEVTGIEPREVFVETVSEEPLKEEEEKEVTPLSMEEEVSEPEEDHIGNNNREVEVTPIYVDLALATTKVAKKPTLKF